MSLRLKLAVLAVLLVVWCLLHGFRQEVAAMQQEVDAINAQGEAVEQWLREMRARK